MLTGGQDGDANDDKKGDALDIVEVYDLDYGFVTNLPRMNQAR